MGLSRLTNGIWTSYTTADGLLNDEIDDIAVNGARTHLWFSEADDGVGRVYSLYGLDERMQLPFVSRD
jgi:hypothetical protein